MGDSIPFWHELYEHPNYDAWWKARNARVGLYNVKPAMLWVGGLFDAEDCFGAWNCFKATEKQSPQTNSRVVIGPWYHGEWASHDGTFLGNVQFGSNTAEYFQDSIEIPFFNYYLLGSGNTSNIAKANIFFSGENDWKKFDVWPPKNVELENLYLGSDGNLSLNEKAKDITPYDEYTSDPAHPVPYTQDVHFRRTREYMDDDQRFASRRPDVLTYESPILGDNVTIAGPVIADLMASISTTDADFVVKLIDVYPDDFKYDSPTPVSMDEVKRMPYPMGGYEMLVRAEIMRGKFRNSFSKPEPFVPGKISEVKWELTDVAHTFLKGHRIMIQIQSSWFPLVDRNPQKFIDIYKADDKDFQKANIRIYHDGDHESKIILPVLK